MGIEPTSEAWEASILPLYDARSARRIIHERRRTGHFLPLFASPTLAIFSDSPLAGLCWLSRLEILRIVRSFSGDHQNGI